MCKNEEDNSNELFIICREGNKVQSKKQFKVVESKLTWIKPHRILIEIVFSQICLVHYYLKLL